MQLLPFAAMFHLQIVIPCPAAICCTATRGSSSSSSCQQHALRAWLAAQTAIAAALTRRQAMCWSFQAAGQGQCCGGTTHRCSLPCQHWLGE